MKLSELSGVGAIMFVAMAGTASAGQFIGSGTPGNCNGCTVTVFGTSTLNTAPSNLPFAPLNLGSSAVADNGLVVPSTNPITPGAGNGLAAAGISSITFTGGSANGASPIVDASGLYTGNTNDIALSPFGGGPSTGENNPNPNQNYLVAQPNVPNVPDQGVAITYTSPQNTFALLWGTVDNGAAENDLKLTITMGGSSFTLTGMDIANIISGAAPGAGQSFTNGALNVGVEITNLDGTDAHFTTVTATDTSANSAFEFDPLVVPAPPIGHGLAAVLAVCGGLFGFKLWERSKTRRAPGIATPLAAA